MAAARKGTETGLHSGKLLHFSNCSECQPKSVSERGSR